MATPRCGLFGCRIRSCAAVRRRRQTDPPNSHARQELQCDDCNHTPTGFRALLRLSGSSALRHKRPSHTATPRAFRLGAVDHVADAAPCWRLAAFTTMPAQKSGPLRTWTEHRPLWSAGRPHTRESRLGLFIADEFSPRFSNAKRSTCSRLRPTAAQPPRPGLFGAAYNNPKGHGSQTAPLPETGKNRA